MKYSLLLMVALLLGAACSAPGPDSNAPPPDALETIVRDYGSWTRLLKEPRNVSSILMALCRTQTSEEKAYQESEHAQYLVQLYVNPTGAAIMRQSGARVFPEGSAVVKEKWAHDERFGMLDAPAPAGLGIMVKGKNGWMYAYKDEKGALTRDQTQLAHCRACHEGNQARDAVFYPAVLTE